MSEEHNQMRERYTNSTHSPSRPGDTFNRPTMAHHKPVDMTKLFPVVNNNSNNNNTIVVVVM